MLGRRKWLLLVLLPLTAAVTPFMPSQKTRRATPSATTMLVRLRRDAPRGWSQNTPGVSERAFVSRRAWLVDATQEGREALRKRKDVITIETWDVSQKFAPGFFSLCRKTLKSLPVDIRVNHAEDLSAVAQRVKSLGGKIVAQFERPPNLRVEILPQKLMEMADDLAVQWFSPVPELKLCNNLAPGENLLNVAPVVETLGLDGSGQIVGHADTGIDTGDLSNMHPDLADRIISIHNWYDGAEHPYDGNGHGTHTAGSIVGTGVESGGLYKGMAPGAKLVEQTVTSRGGTFGSFGLYELFRQTYEEGARIHSDSWVAGDADSYGIYETYCEALDWFVWEHPDFLPVFAAGNDGRDRDSNGVVDQCSVLSPASAKNVLSVGATKTQRKTGKSAAMHNYAISSLYGWPLYSDFLTYSTNSACGMAAFSSRGPALDGRIKPEVVAPGSDICSTGSSKAYYSRQEYDGLYGYLQGTSMATPLTAGCAALVRQWLVEQKGIESPSAALLRAIIAGGARSISPGQYGEGQWREIPAASPNNVEGWGLVDVGNSIAPEGLRVRVYDDVQDDEEFSFTVIEDGQELSFALAWVDYPAGLYAETTLCNDYDLVVLSPSGERFYPNDLQSEDRTNNLETVRIASASAGTWTVKVAADFILEQGGAVGLWARGAFAEEDERPSVTVHLMDNLSGETLATIRERWSVGETVSIDLPDYFEVDGAGYGLYAWDEELPQFVLDGAKVFYAWYCPVDFDLDGNGLATWWELRYFGAEGNSPDYDPDGDGWDNLAESLDGTDPNDPLDFPRPPVVSPLPVDTTVHPPWTISAEVTDNFAVRSVRLFWREEKTLEWTEENTPVFTNGHFSVSVQHSSLGARALEYWWEAMDYSLATTTETFRAEANFAEPWASVSPEAEQFASAEYSVQNIAGPEMCWTCRVSAATAPISMEEGWEHSGKNDGWHRTTRRNWNGKAVWWCGNDTTGAYDCASEAALDSPWFVAPQNGYVIFRHWCECEADDEEGMFWDGACVMVAREGGEFTQVFPHDGYDGRVVKNDASPFAALQPCFGSTSGEWKTVWLDLSEYAGETVRLRFFFGSDAYETAEGWYVTDLCVCELQQSPYSSGTLSAGTSAKTELSFDESALEPDIEWTRIAEFSGNFAKPLLRRLNLRKEPFLKQWQINVVSLGETRARIADDGELISESVNTYTNETATTRKRCLGWTMGSESGDSSVVEWTASADAQLVWRWTNQYAVTIAAVGDGTVEPSGGWFDAQAQLSFLAKVNEYWNFSHWLVGVRQSKTNPLTFRCSAAVTRTAVFEPIVTELRGVPYWWLAKYALAEDGDFESAAERDEDSDGFAAWQEWRADTDPTNAASRLAIVSFDPFVWVGGVNATQRLQKSSSPLGPWSDLQTNYPPTTVTNTAEVDTSAPSAFFRIVVE